MTFQAIILSGTTAHIKMRTLGAYAIANELREHGYTALVLEHFYSLGQSKQYDILKKIISKDTLFVGYSTSLIPHVLQLSRTETFFYDMNCFIKTINPNVKIILGGSSSIKLSNHNSSTQRTAGFDYVMHGYSEGMIVKFMNDLANTRKPAFSKVNNKLYTIEHDMTGSTFDFRNSTHKWHETDYIFKNETLPIEIARGCVFRCKFCAFPLLGKNKNDDSYIKREDILEEEIRTNYEKYNTLSYMIMDDTFNERTDKIEMMLRIRDKLKLDLDFSGYARLDLISRKPEQLPLLKDLNFNKFQFGIESLNYESAKSIGKGIRPEEVTETLHKIKNIFGNEVLIQGMFIAGLPHETQETFDRWFTEILDTSYPLDVIKISTLIITQTNAYSESVFLKDYKKYGYSLPTPNTWVNDHWSSEIASVIVEEKKKEIQRKNRNSFGGFVASGLHSLGHNIRNIKLARLDYTGFLDRLGVANKERLEEYIKYIESL